MIELAKAGWKEKYGENLDVTTLRAAFLPANRYRISEFTYPAGTTINGSMLAGICFTLAGSVYYRYDDSRVRLQAGEWAELPAGSYELEVEGCGEAKLILVWKILTT